MHILKYEFVQTTQVAKSGGSCLP